jgi:hypothetical protein
MGGRGMILGVVLLGALPACGGGGLTRLPESALLGLPNEGRRWVFDAENAIVAALDGVDVAGEGVREADEQIARAERSLKAAEKRQREKSTELGVQAARARLEWARLQRRIADERLELARTKVRKARADLELDKARLVVAYDLVAVRGFTLQPFEQQAQAAQGRLDAVQKGLDMLGKKLQEQEEQMQQARQRYVAQTGDHDSGVWLD